MRHHVRPGRQVRRRVVGRRLLEGRHRQRAAPRPSPAARGRAATTGRARRPPPARAPRAARGRAMRRRRRARARRARRAGAAPRCAASATDANGRAATSRFAASSPQPEHVAQPEPHRRRPRSCTSTPSASTSIGRTATPWRCASFTSVAGCVEAHRPAVEQRARERRRVVRLQVRRGVGDQREARRVRLGEAVEREGGDAAARSPPARAPVMPRAAMPSRRRCSIACHALDRALEAHRAAQLLGLAAGEAGDRHRHAQELLLEERHAERAGEDRLERRDARRSPARARRGGARYGCTICPTIGPGRMIATSTTRS